MIARYPNMSYPKELLRNAPIPIFSVCTCILMNLPHSVGLSLPGHLITELYIYIYIVGVLQEKEAKTPP